jgi:hypothetical protein
MDSSRITNSSNYAFLFAVGGRIVVVGVFALFPKPKLVFSFSCCSQHEFIFKELQGFNFF